MFWRRDSKKSQLKSIFNWLTTVAGDKDIIFVDLPRMKGYFRFEFPLKYGDYPIKIGEPSTELKSTFVVKTSSKISLEESWIKIFSSSEVEVFENRDYRTQIKPIRWGFDDEDKKILIKIARDALENFLTDGMRLNREYFQTLPPRFFLKTDLDIALWVRGYLRGSAVVENLHLGEAIADAAIQASRDPRFKPITHGELPCVRIEVTIFSDCRIPLIQEEFERGSIYAEKGYLLESGTHRGWFLPEVFNVRRFANLEAFLTTLAREKAGLEHFNRKKSKVFIFEVDDFIESESHADRKSVV